VRDERAGSAPRQVVLTDEGPVLVVGPVDLVLPDGAHVTSDRPVTAVCACKRSRRYPFCDASHRTKVRAAGEPAC
jgi:CDGSH-type Zn-finger protein